MSKPRQLQTSLLPGQPVLSPAHKRFNALLRQIEQARKTLHDWQNNIPVFQQAFEQQMLPLQTTYRAARRQHLFALDALFDQPGWSRAERQTLQSLITEGADDLLAVDEDDAEIKALYNKHSEVDFDTEQLDLMQSMKGMAEAMTGLDLGEMDDVGSEAELMARLQERMAADAADQQAAQASASAQPGKKPKSQRATAAQQRREAEARQATQSVREIYRKLASALHPDREPDEAQRSAKTALMQRVNQAYAASDLLALLELQLEIEQVDASHIANASADRIKHYNKVLAEQLDGLRFEIERVEIDFCLEFGIDIDSPVRPDQLGALIDHEARDLRSVLARQQADQRRLADKPATRRWLKSQAQMQRRAMLDGDDFF